MEETYSLVSINTWKCDGLYPDRLHWMVEQLAQLQPDIILTQEVFRSEKDSLDTLVLLYDGLKNHGLRYHHHFSTARSKFRRVNGENLNSLSGLAIFSKHPILHTEKQALPDHPQDRDRPAAWVELEFPEGPLLLVNSHLTHLKEDDLRKEQIASVLSNPILKKKTYSGIFWGGDFNCLNDAPEFQALSNDFCLTNTHFLTNRKDDPLPVTLPPKAPDKPGKWIDFIFLLENSYTPKIEILNSRQVLDALHPDGYYASDHFGIMIEFRWNSIEQTRR